MINFLKYKKWYRIIKKSGLFDENFYLDTYADVRRSDVDPIMHYIRFGWKERRNPSKDFETKFYLEYYKDVEENGINPLIHYILHGKNEGKITKNTLTLTQRINNIKKTTTSKTPLSKALSKINTTTITPACRHESMKYLQFPLKDTKVTKKDIKIGVFIHIYYLDLADEIISYTNNIPFNSNLYITTNSKEKQKDIEKKMQTNSKHNFEIKITPNIGRDIAPMLIAFKDKFSAIDYALHIHTKKSLHYENGNDNWRKYLLDGLLGSKEIILSHFKLLEQEDVGATMIKYYKDLSDQINWGYNFDLAKTLMSYMSSNELTTDTFLEFPAGSMFWFKADALEPLLSLSLSYEDFDAEKGQIDGTLAHAIERILLHTVETKGYSWVPIKVNDKKGLTENLESYKTRIFPQKRYKDTLGIYYNEISKFYKIKNTNKKPRLNLLVPSANLKDGYAGLSSLVNFYKMLLGHLENTFDFRIISTIVSIQNIANSLDGFTYEELGNYSNDKQFIITDGTKRQKRYLDIRENDIFMASAWWDAYNIIDIQNFQKNSYGNFKKFIYMIQDYEAGFYAWSTKFELARMTYVETKRYIPVFNTEILYDFFKDRFKMDNFFILQPGMNPNISKYIDKNIKKEKIILIYLRHHAERNCYQFLDALIYLLVEKYSDISKWKIYGIGEDFSDTKLFSKNINVLGRLTLKEYGELLSKASVGISLMVSPHPSYPPLEMANAGLLVLANSYDNKNLSNLHENIISADELNIEKMSDMLYELCKKSQTREQIEYNAKCDWFFDGKTNINQLSKEVARTIKKEVSV